MRTPLRERPLGRGRSALRTLVVSDLHLGSQSKRDALRDPSARARLLDAASSCDRLVLLRGGRVLAQGPTADVLTGAMVQQLYDVDADVQFHARAGHLTVVPVSRTR